MKHTRTGTIEHEWAGREQHSHRLKRRRQAGVLPGECCTLESKQKREGWVAFDGSVRNGDRPCIASHCDHVTRSFLFWKPARPEGGEPHRLNDPFPSHLQQMLARLVATRPTVSLASTAAATSTSTTHAAQQHVRAFSFFSSKSGGGGDGNGNKHKYFTANSSSSRRSSPPNGANGNGGNGGAASSKPKMDGNTTTTVATTATTVGPASSTETTDPTTTTATTTKSQLPEDPAKKGDSSPTVNVSPSSSPPTPNLATSGQRWTTSWQPQPMHSPLTPKDLNLHGFFAGHRPLLLLSQPSSTIFESWPDLQLSNRPDPMVSHHESLLNQLGGINLEDPPEPTPEADADAARLLNRALVVNRLGGAVSWEETLARLGVVEERMSLAEMGMGVHDVMDVSMMNGFDAYMDSTKRKRRKKMKKHKLKKRRRVRPVFPPP